MASGEGLRVCLSYSIKTQRPPRVVFSGRSERNVPDISACLLESFVLGADVFQVIIDVREGVDGALGGV